MMKNLRLTLCSLGVVGALLAACGKKPEPKSVSTTSTQTTKQDDTGESSKTNTKTTTTEMPNGSSTVETTQKTSTSVPANGSR